MGSGRAGAHRHGLVDRPFGVGPIERLRTIDLRDSHDRP